MPFYENVFIARQDLTPAKVNELTDKYATYCVYNKKSIFHLDRRRSSD